MSYQRDNWYVLKCMDNCHWIILVHDYRNRFLHFILYDSNEIFKQFSDTSELDEGWKCSPLVGLWNWPLVGLWNWPLVGLWNWPLIILWNCLAQQFLWIGFFGFACKTFISLRRLCLFQLLIVVVVRLLVAAAVVAVVVGLLIAVAKTCLYFVFSI